MMTVALDSFYAACPGIVVTRDIDNALHTLADGSSAAAIRAAVLPLVPGGALPPQPIALLPIDGNPALGTVATFAKGLRPFQDSNPDPLDGWSLEREHR